MKKLFASLSLLALAACQTQTGSTDGETIKIGFISPLTGDFAGMGADILNGVKLRVDAVNTAGGINGRMVELIAEDGKCTGTEAASAAQKLVNVDGVVAIVGGVCSSETLAAAPIVEAGKVLLVSGVSSSPDITNAGDYVFRNYPSDDLKGKAFANLFTSKGYTKIAMITENTDFCQGIVRSIEKYLPEGVEIVFNENVEPSTKDYRSLITRLQDTEFDAFIVNTQTDTTGGLLLTQLRELGITQPTYGTDTTDSSSMFTLAEGALDNFYVISVPVFDENSSFAQDFKTAYGDPKFGYPYAAQVYDSASVILDAIAAEGTDNPEALKQHLYDMPNYKGVSGTFRFDENGDAIGYSYALKEFKDGTISSVEDLPVQ